MIVAVQGTSEFNDYFVFLRAMSVALSGMKEDDNEFIIYSVGPSKINNFVSEFSNLSERGMKARGKKIKFIDNRKHARRPLEPQKHKIRFLCFKRLFTICFYPFGNFRIKTKSIRKSNFFGRSCNLF